MSSYPLVIAYVVEAHPETTQTFKMKPFLKIANTRKPST